ncbi:MAG: hypothetical protein K8R99_11530 [Actinomycetia bacterium]|nr:hypothetical protein [Actinomycetes bacterium]
MLLSLWDGPFSLAKVGTVGDWMAALGTVLAAFVALTAAGRAEREAESRRLRDRDDRELRWTKERDLATAERALRAIGVASIEAGVPLTQPQLDLLDEQLTIEYHVALNEELRDRLRIGVVVLAIARKIANDRLRTVMGYMVLSISRQLQNFINGAPLPPWQWSRPGEDDYFRWPEKYDEIEAFVTELGSG